MILDLITRNRSYRRFHEDKPVSTEVLQQLVNLARLCASARNGQSLKYFLSNDPKTNNEIFTTLAWAAYLKDWNGPEAGERPSAYIVILNDTTITSNYYCDHGIATQSILLGAVEKGLGGCIIASVNREELRVNLSIPKHFEIVHVIALGEPGETVVIEPLPATGDYKYWRDDKQVHHVPKRSLEDIIVKF